MRQNVAPENLPVHPERERTPLVHCALRPPVRRALARFFACRVEDAEHPPVGRRASLAPSQRITDEIAALPS